MMVAMLLLVIFHPGRSLVGPESEFPRLSRKEKKAAKQEKKAAKKADKEAKRQKPLQSSSENLQEDVEGQVTPPQASYEESRRYYAMEVEEEPRR